MRSRQNERTWADGFCFLSVRDNMTVAPRPGGILSGLSSSALSLAIGAVGGALFYSAGLPAPWFLGPIIAMIFASPFKLKLSLPPLIKGLAFVILGFSIGSNFTADNLVKAINWPVSILILAICVFLSIKLISFALTKILGWNHVTSLLAATPGSMSIVTAYAAETSAEIGQVVGTHLTRLILMVTIFPLMAEWAGVMDAASVSAEAIVVNWAAVMTGIAWSAGGAYFLTKARIPAGALLGAMLVSLFVHGTGINSATSPHELLPIAYVVIGTFVGLRVIQAGNKLDKKILLAGALSLFIATAISIGAAVIAGLFLEDSFLQLFLGFAPGGMEVMVILALTVGCDPSFVAIHQVFRFFLIIVLLPSLVRGRN